MHKNKIILKNCPNFYKIKNYEFEENDLITQKIISIYEEYIFNIDVTNKTELDKIKELDRILNKYIEDYTFRKEIQSGLLDLKIKRGGSVIDIIINKIMSLYNNYEDGYTRNIYFARWI